MKYQCSSLNTERKLTLSVNHALTRCVQQSVVFISLHDLTNNLEVLFFNLFKKRDDNKKFWEELITYFALTRHGPH
jgi:hypothetical protein